EIHFVTYRNSIEQNLLALLMAKERINDFVKTLELRPYSDIYDQHDFDLGILEQVLTREFDKEGRSYLKWGKQEFNN
ncbi:MAG: hypothetical protein GTN82_15565, partial [Candidatus Aminicenantes bacterium]|nr:hypothetical protein [Candidatus Aminicenantes bacterium]